MNEYPKKIWFDIDDCSAGPVQIADDEISYIRADLVDEVVEALKEILEEPFDGVDVARIARVALAKLEES